MFLVVEDIPTIRAMMVEICKMFDGEIIEAQNGLEGLDQYRRNLPDIVFTDIDMPIMDGLEMTRQVRIINPQARVIVVSSRCDPQMRMHAAQSGASDFISKPVNPEKIRRVLTKSRKFNLHV